ncbi:MAG: FAD-dependent oxidoreductase [Methanomassiliicoccales archaeon]
MSHVLVVGNGAAGTFSSWLLAKRGWRVTLVGRGTPSTAMSTGCLRSGPNLCRAEISEFLDNEKMPWTSGSREGISKIGTSYRCWNSPSHSTWNDSDAPKSIAVVGLDGHPSLQPHIISALLNARKIEARPFIIPSQVPSDVPLASSFLKDEAWETLAEELQGLSTEAILLPSFVTLQDYHRLDQLERRCGRTVMEAIAPLGAAGQRLADLMRWKAADSGVIIWDGRRATALDVQADAVRGATIAGGREVRDIAVDAVIIATGGPLVDGLVLKERDIGDPFGKFQIVRSEDPLKGGYDSSDGMLINISGRVMNNVAGAGDCISSEGRIYGSGLTEALESAYLAVRALEGA